MPGPRCSPPKSSGVRSYTRAAPGRRRKAKPKPAATGTYWTCVNSRTHDTCRTHHRNSSAAYKHSKRLNLTSYRAGRGRLWDPQKRGG
jgi:hypothetical protein